MIVSDTTETIVIAKSAATNTTDPHCVVSFREESTLRGDVIGIAEPQRSTIIGTGDVTVLSAPSQNQIRRVIGKCWVYNTDAIAHTFTVKHNTGGTTRTIKRLQLDVNQSAEYSSDGGW